VASPGAARSVQLSAGLATLALTFAATACSTPTATVGPDSAASPAPAAPTEPTQEDALSYRDGQYTATGWYGGLPSHQDVTLTVTNDTVTAVSITTPAEDDTSLGYQQRFADALPTAIVGRDIDELAVDRLAGSSGCSEGFMNALDQIKADAAA
jgi:uncharacterized protein with FMN-binding domain